MLIAFNKPYGVLSQFTPDGSANRTLAEFQFPANVYAIGRLDADSEGLLLLSDEPALNAQLLLPRIFLRALFKVRVLFKHFPDEEERPLFDLGVDTPDVLAQDTEAKHLYAPHEEDGQDEDKNGCAQPDAPELTVAGSRGLRGMALRSWVGFAVGTLQGGFRKVLGAFG